MGFGGAALGAAALAAVGLGRGARGPAPADELLVIDEADPLARPRVYRGAEGIIDVPLIPTSTPTLTPTATPTSTPTATPTLTRRELAKLQARPAWSSDLLRQVVREGPRTRPLVGLTIDDGWTSRDAVLDVIQAKDIQPTLFLAGRPIAGDYGFIARALNAGCEIANHTMDHYDLTKQSYSYIQKDLADFEALVTQNVTGASTKPFMRPSGGSLNQTVIDASASAGYRPVLWSISTGDGSASTTPSQMVSYGLAGVRPGSIILMHFSARAITALPALVDGLRAKGLEPVSLSKLFEETGA